MKNCTTTETSSYWSEYSMDYTLSCIPYIINNLIINLFTNKYNLMDSSQKVKSKHQTHSKLKKPNFGDEI